MKTMLLFNIFSTIHDKHEVFAYCENEEMALQIKKHVLGNEPDVKIKPLLNHEYLDVFSSYTERGYVLVYMDGWDDWYDSMEPGHTESQYTQYLKTVSFIPFKTREEKIESLT